MVNLKSWLREQGLSVRELAVQLDLPRKTVEDWVYRGAVASPINMERLNKFMACKHYWVIDRPNGRRLSEGVLDMGYPRLFDFPSTVLWL